MAQSHPTERNAMPATAVKFARRPADKTAEEHAKAWNVLLVNGAGTRRPTASSPSRRRRRASGRSCPRPARRRSSARRSSDAIRNVKSMFIDVVMGPRAEDDGEDRGRQRRDGRPARAERPREDRQARGRDRVDGRQARVREGGDRPARPDHPPAQAAADELRARGLTRAT
jgi:hypothetical protein